MSPSRQQYLRDFWAACAAETGTNTAESVIRQPPSTSRAWLCDRKQQVSLKLTDEDALGPATTTDDAVILIEDISLDWIAILGCTFDIDVVFFRTYLSGLQGPSPWKAVFGTAVSDIKRPAELHHNYQTSHHIDGVFQLGQPDQMQSIPQSRPGTNVFHRRVENHAPFGWEFATRISYCRLRQNLYLFLVDAPINVYLKEDRPSAMPTLHLPISTSRGGLMLPALFYRGRYSLLETMKEFFSHAWHFSVLMGRDVSAETIIYVLTASTWKTNLRVVDQKLKRIAFADIRRPNIKINDQLHDIRELLAQLQTQVSNAKRYIPDLVRTEMKDTTAPFWPPDSTFAEILEESETAGRFLMDTFQLLMSSISVLDSETSIQQARSGQKLTQLASIFIPLSLVTGIFGMNIKEINESPLSVWVVVVTFLITALCTMGIFHFLDQEEGNRRRIRDCIQG